MSQIIYIIFGFGKESKHPTIYGSASSFENLKDAIFKLHDVYPHLQFFSTPTTLDAKYY